MDFNLKGTKLIAYKDLFPGTRQNPEQRVLTSGSRVETKLAYETNVSGLFSGRLLFIFPCIKRRYCFNDGLVH